MLRCLDQFVFELKTAPYLTHRRDLRWRQAGPGRVGLLPARQYLGPEAETNTFEGILYPELTGGPVSLAALEAMAAAGKAYLMTAGTGELLGHHVIVSLSTTSILPFPDGTARRIEVQLVLERVDDTDVRAAS